MEAAPTQSAVLDSSLSSDSSDQCEALCGTRKQIRGHGRGHGGDGRVKFLSCSNEEGEWTCTTCSASESSLNVSHGVKANVTSVVYGSLCSSPPSAGGTKERSSSGAGHNGLGATAAPVPHGEKNVSVLWCRQSACCQCGRDGAANPLQGTTFAICIVLAVIGVGFNCNILMFFDALTMELLKDRRKDYGKNRLWGAISWGIFAFLSGVAIDVYTDLTGALTDRFEPAFVMYLVMMAVCAAVFARMRLPDHTKPDAMQKNLRAVLSDGETILFLFIVVVMGISFILSFTYVFIFLKELESPYLLMGLAVALTAVAEIPFMYFSGAIIKRVGYRGVMYMTLLAYAIRYFGYSLVYNPWVILPVQLLHGITYGLAWPMFTAFANTVAPRGMASTLQSIVACSFMGIGSGIGNFLGGFIYQEYGARMLFRLTGTMCILALIVFFLLSQFVLKRKEGESADEEKEAKESDCKDTKDAQTDAAKWDDEEKIGNGIEDETKVMVAPNQNQNNVNVDVHSTNF